MEDAKKLGAIPFDVQGVELGHHGYDALYAYCLEMIRQAKPNGAFKD